MAARNMPGPGGLVLFDIDGTLVRRAGPHHRQALVDAIRLVSGLETTTDGIPLHGMLDPDIISIMMRNTGAPDWLIRRSMRPIQRAAQSRYVRECPNIERKVCPGVRRLLGRLHRLGIPMGLVTGNLTRIGWKKVERAGLKEYFRFGAFGEMSKDRSGLVRLAVREARTRGWSRNGTRIALIGDSPADVRAARANGIFAVAVCTGISTPEELADEQPDLLVPDLRALLLQHLIAK